MSIITNLNRRYEGGSDIFCLSIPRWEIEDRGITALSGPSGSGKTSVLRTLLGLDTCLLLSWVFDTVDLAQLSPKERRLGVVFQSYELFTHLSARDNIAFAAKARKIIGWEKKLEHLADSLKLHSFLQRKARHLSGGESQRVALARALIGEPRMLLLDEPFSALDSALRSQARGFLQDSVQEFQIPALLVTHDEEDIEALAHSVVRIQNGSLV